MNGVNSKTIVTREIVELNTTDTYRLKDKEGWCEAHRANGSILRSKPELVKGFKLDDVECADGWYHDDVVIEKSEYSFFEIITLGTPEKIRITSPHGDDPNTSSDVHLWDGDETLEVGMHLSRKNAHNCLLEVLKFNLVTGQALLGEVEGSTWNVVEINDLVSLKKSHYGLTLEKVLKAWKGRGIDYADDTASSSVPMREMFEVVYNVMKGEEDV